MLISIITPTARRPSFLPLIRDCVLAQDWPEWEWLVDDTSPAPSGDLNDPRVRYEHHPQPQTIGAKRNRLVQRARGQLIAHFDDDDYYAPGYLTAMTERLGNAAMVKLTGFFAYRVMERRLAYCDLTNREGPRVAWRGREPARDVRFGPEDSGALEHQHLGYGFSYLYRRSAWEGGAFEDRSFDEDTMFARRLARSGGVAGFADRSGLALHLHHHNNSSTLFPAQLLPDAAVGTLFPEAGAHLEAVHRILEPKFEGVARDGR